MKKAVKISIVIVAVLLVVLTGASFYFYNVAIARTNKEFLNNDEDLESEPVVADQDKKYDWFSEHELRDVEMMSDDGLKLRGYYFKSEKPTEKTVILAHGYSSQGKEMVSFARFFYDDLGFNVLIPDNRGHGRSEGNNIGFGWLDRKDYLKWIDYVISETGNDAQIVLLGVSMGGATVLMTSGETLPDQVKAIVSDCAYTSVKDELKYQLNRMYNLPSFPFIQTTSLMTKIRAGYYFGEASAVEQVKKSITPILFIHGDADKFVPYEMVNVLYEACNSEKDLLVVSGAGHGSSYRVDPDNYEKKVKEFLGKYITGF